MSASATRLRLFFGPVAPRCAPMSLNRSEQLVSDYIEGHPDEKSFWVEKVRSIANADPDGHVAAARLSDELWSYYEERAAVAEPFKSLAMREGLRRTSMRNLAELWIRLWVAPKPKRRDEGKKFADYF